MTGILNALIAGVSGAVKDTYFNLVSLLLPGNGTDGANNNFFLDSSSNNFTITRNPTSGPNAPTQGTFSPFSQTGWGASFSGSNQLTLPSALALAPEAGQFCIEFWIYPTASWGSVDRPIFVTAGSGGLWVGWQATAFVLRAYGVTNHLTYGTAPTLNTWTHVAICRNSGNTTSMYFNGSRVATGTVTQNFAQAISYVGSDTAYGGSGAALLMASNLSNLRLVKGSSVYDPTQTSITVPTSPLTAITNTTLLICQSNRFVDNSTANSGSGWTVTSNGNVTITSFSPFAPTAAYTTAAVGGSGYFDGTGDYLTAPNNAALQLTNSTAWCIELWFYATAMSSVKTIFNKFSPSGSPNFNGFSLTFGANSQPATTLTFWDGTAWTNAASGLAPNQWYHFAVSYEGSGTTRRFFLNGQIQGSAGTVPSTIQNTNDVLAIGALTTGSESFPGYISNLRFVKGSAVYTSNFTPPTSPLTAITNTSLLLNFTNAGITDATAKNDLETVGNAQISTSVSKFGGGSIAFDGNGDYCLIPSSSLLNFQTGNFVIEMWFYIAGNSSTNNDGNRVAALLSSAPTTGIQLEISGNTTTTGTGLVFYNLVSGTAYSISYTGTISQSSWHHLAIARSGTTTRIFLDGTSVASGTLGNQSITSANSLLIGATPTTGYLGYLNGYIDDLRFTNGNDRGYTGSTITVPSAPFPVQ